jgi:signal transduction histidine kinase
VKLQIKVVLLVMVVLLVTGLVSGGMMLYVERRASVQQFEQVATALAGAVQGSLEHSMLTGKLQPTQEALVSISAEAMVNEVVVLSPDGTIAASSQVADINRTMDGDEIRQALHSGETSVKTGEQNGQSRLWVTTPVINQPECQDCHPSENNVLGAVQVSLDTTALDNQMRQQTIFFGALGILTLLVIGGGLTFVLRSMVLNPLSRLAESAERLSRGDYSARASSHRNDETGRLARTFNEMAESVEERRRELEASRQELANWNMDLEEKIQRRTGELSALNAIITTISQSLDLDKVLNDALKKILTVLDMEAGVVHLLDEKTGQLVIASHRGMVPGYVRKTGRLKPGEGIIGQVAQSGESIFVNDPARITLSGKKGEFRSSISLPVKSKNKVLGTVTLASYSAKKFEPGMVGLLSAIGEALGIAVENARGTRSLEEANIIREQLLEKLISAQEEERRRIARELHDEASQSLAALAFNLEDIADTLPPEHHDIKKKLATLQEHAIRTLGGIRNLALELRPSALDDLGLSMAIDWYAKDFLAKRGLDVAIKVTGSKTKLPSYTETILFRIIQEALTNIVKHSGANQVKVRLHLGDTTAIVQVEDNGTGFNVEATLKRKSIRRKLGIHGMMERAALLGGTLTIQSQPGHGTSLHVEVPVKEDIKHEPNKSLSGR